MQTQVEGRLLDYYHQLMQYEEDLHGGRLNSTEYNHIIGKLEVEIISVYGSLKPFHDFIKPRIIQQQKPG